MFWEQFCGLCSEKNLKPNTVAKELGISSAAVTKWKNGSIPGGEILLAIADFLECSVDYLLGRKDKSFNVAINSPMSAQGDNNSINVSNVNVKRDGMLDEMLKQFETLSFADKAEIMHIIAGKAKNEQA